MSILIVLASLVFLGFWAHAAQYAMIPTALSAVFAVGLTFLNILWSAILVLWQILKRRREAKQARRGDAASFKIYIAVEVVDLLFWTVLFIFVLVSVFTNVLNKDDALEISILTFDALSLWSYLVQLVGLYNGAILYIEQNLEPVRKDGFRTLDEKHALESTDGHNMNAADLHQLYDPYNPVV
ncbi:hypothetical protein PsYK624_046050 [Phanerochaete sordida]|uniref:Uncharacterized protein n=1 Tax=Phanerochaete sordida TaxID=48140 RepID=A0A9P3G3N9_9APHY|nr:hypothetical protein PsYK624_046050 [Phanerochaete sordida]